MRSFHAQTSSTHLDRGQVELVSLSVIAQGGLYVGLWAACCPELLHGSVQGVLPVLVAASGIHLAGLVQQVAPHDHAVRPGVVLLLWLLPLLWYSLGIKISAASSTDLNRR